MRLFNNTILYFALNTIVLLIGVILWLLDEKGVSSSLIAAGLIGYIMHWSNYLHQERTQAHIGLLQKISRFGISDINERRLLFDDYAAARKRTQERLDIMGFGLRHFIEDCGREFPEWSKQFEMRILVIHPDSTNCDQRDYEENDAIGKIRRDVLDTTEFVLKLKDERVQIRWYMAIPFTNLLRMDNVMWVGPYFCSERSRNAYVLKLTGDSQLFNQYRHHFDRIWDDPNLSASPTSEMLEEAQSAL